MVPDLVVEIVWPSDRLAEVAEKVDLYRRFGVPLIWEVEPRRRVVLAHEADGAVPTFRLGHILAGGAVLPTFRLPLAELFAEGEEPSWVNLS